MSFLGDTVPLIRDLAAVLNKYGLDTELDTSDAILAAHLADHLTALGSFLRAREYVEAGCPRCGAPLLPDVLPSGCSSCGAQLRVSMEEIDG